MEKYVINDSIFLFQLICAGLCGTALGVERQSRMKSAGVRTHFIVSVASALMMIVSKYGFLDVISIEGVSVDISRVAAGIISGIGILGGGLIFISKQGLVRGMTTAAGIWMTVGIGMAIGARMYVLGFEGTILILIMQCLFHRKLEILKDPLRAKVMFLVGDKKEDVETIVQKLESIGIEVSMIKIERKGEKNFQMKCETVLPRNMERDDFTEKIVEIENLLSYEV